MNPPAPEPPDPLVPLLVAYDEGLAVGHTAAPPLPDELGQRFRGARDVLHILERVWPRGEGAPDQAVPPAFLPARMPAVQDLVPGLGEGVESPAEPPPHPRPLSPEAGERGERPGASRPEGVRLGRFRIERELGRGGFGVVFLASDPMLNRRVALKVPRPDVMLTPEVRRRFLREGRAAAALDHPNLVPVYEADEIGPVCYIASAYVEGPTLAAWLRQHPGPVPAPTAARLAAALADGVAAAHRAGVVHRDLKPANILIADGRSQIADWKEGATPGDKSEISDLQFAIPKVTDFGLAKLLDEDGDTRTGDRLGTLAYMAPEQHEGRHRAVGPATDVYALGLILYELLTGRPLFHGQADGPTVPQVGAGAGDGPRRLAPGVPRDLETICLKCLEREPARRYLDAGALADDLHRYLAGEPIRARRVTAVGRAVRWVRRRPALVSLSLALVLALFGLGYAVSQLGPPPVNLSPALQDLAVPEDPAVSLANYAQAINRVAGHWEREEYREYEKALEEIRAQPKLAALGDFELRHLLARHPPGFVQRFVLGKPIPALDWSPDGKTLAAGTWGNGVRLFDTSVWEKGKPLQDPGIVLALAFAPSGRVLAWGSPDRRIILRDLATGKERSLEGHPGQVNSLSFSPDGRRLAATNTPSPDGPSEFRIWDVKSGECIFTLPPKNPKLVGCTFLRYGVFVALGASDGGLYRYETDTGKVYPVPYQELSPGLVTLSASPSKSMGYLTAATPGGRLTRPSMIDTDPGCPFLRQQGPGIASLATSRNGRWVASGHEDGTVRIWDPWTLRLITGLKVREGLVKSVSFSPDGRSLAVGTEVGDLSIWDLSRIAPSWEIYHHPEAWGVAFAPDGKTLVTSSDDNTVKVWDTATWKEKKSLTDHGQMLVTRVAYSPDGRTFATGDYRGVIKIWDAATLKVRHAMLKGENGPIRSLAYSADGQTLASGGEKGAFRLWDVNTGDEVRRRTAEGNEAIWGLTYSPDGKLLAEGWSEGTVRLWEVSPAGARLKNPRELHEDFLLRSLAFSPDGKTLACGNVGGQVVLWDVATGKEKARWKAHDGEIHALVFSVDGRTLATGSDDGKVKLWQASTGAFLLTALETQHKVHGLAFNKEGSTLAVTNHGGAVHILYGPLKQ